jgi:hypothetical protein
MTFEEPDPDDASVPNYGCPYLSAHGAGWLIGWYRPSGDYTGSSIAKADALAWIIANPDAVALEQTQLQTWFKSLKN